MRSVLPVLLASAFAAGARADGMIDPSFGSGGTVVVSLADNERVNSVVVTPAGDVVAVGNKFLGPPPSTGRMVMLWVLPSGAPKPSFGTNGFLVVDFPGNPNARGNSIVAQSDGKVVVAGHAGGLAALVRFDANGALDASFGAGGRVLWTCAGGCGVDALALQPDGRIVAVAEASGGDVVARFLPDGSFDPSFGAAGVVTVPRSWNFHSTAAAVRDGRIFLGGAVGAGLPEDLAAVRLLADGTPDPAFDGDGLAVLVRAGTQLFPPGSLVVQEGGAVVLGGTSFSDTEPATALAVRFLANGTPDPRFGTGGVANGESGASGVIVELPDGKLMQSGTASGPDWNLRLVRYLPDGQRDLTFGTASVLEIVLDERQVGTTLVYAGPERLVIGGYNEILGGFTGENLLLARVIATTPVALQSFVVE